MERTKKNSLPDVQFSESPLLLTLF